MDDYDIVHGYDSNDIDEFECGYVAGLEHLLRSLMKLEIKADLSERHALHHKILRHLGDVE